jgi:hypothetical protein
MKLLNIQVQAPSMASMDHVHIRPSKSYPDVATTFFCGGAYVVTGDMPSSSLGPSRATCVYCLDRYQVLNFRMPLKERRTAEGRAYLKKHFVKDSK